MLTPIDAVKNCLITHATGVSIPHTDCIHVQSVLLCSDVAPRQRELGAMSCQLGSMQWKMMMLAPQTKLPNFSGVFLTDPS